MTLSIKSPIKSSSRPSCCHALNSGKKSIREAPPIVETGARTGIKSQESSAPDPVNHPTQYAQHPSGVECITIAEHMSFNLGNALKYIWRADFKGNARQDLEKAAFYIRREIKRREKFTPSAS